MKTTLPAVALILDDCRGVYIPHDFANEYDWSRFENIDENDMSELLKGPDECEYYWDIWEDVLDNATFTENGNTWRLYQDGSVWLLCDALMTNEEKRNFDIED